jgi:outer membrane protein TolC
MRYKTILLLLTIVISWSTHAQQSYNLSLKEAQDHAIEHNRMLKNASLEVKKAEASRWQAIASMLPQANVNLDYTNHCGYELQFGLQTIPMNPQGNLTAQVAVALSGAQLVGVQLSNIAKSMAELNQQKSFQQITNNVKSIYYSILVMSETVSLLEQNLENMKKLLAFTENSVKVGVAEQTDADQLMVQISSLETNISSTKRSLEMLYNSLRLQLGIDVNAEIVLSQSIDELLNVEKALQLLETDFYVENNFDYQLIEKSADLSKKQIALSAWNYGPTISGFYQYTNKTYFGKDEGFNMTPPNLVGATVKIPIFSSGVNYAKVREAKINHETQLNNLADTEDALKIQHRQLKYNLSSAFESFENQKKNIEVNQRLLDNISKKYEQGMASSLDLTNSGTNLISAQSSYVQALMEVVSAQIALEELLNMSTISKQ